MKCDRCGKPSVYHSTLVVNGVSQTTNLCRDCAMKEGVFNAETIFDDMFSAFTDFLPFEKVNDIVCPVCKTKLIEFKQTGKLGCANCYEVFRNEINKIIKRIAPFEKNKAESVKISASKRTKQSKEEKISALKSELALAVKEERYEDASKIKKQIQKLEAKDE